MTEKTLLASVALFRELYDNQKDIYDVISELIKAALIFSQKWTIDTTSAARLIDEHFDLKIPEAVINTALRQRLSKRDGVVVQSNGGYTVDREKIESSRRYVQDFEGLRKRQSEFIQNLESYIELRNGVLSESKKDDLVAAVCDYFFDDQVQSKYATEISGFIIQHQGDGDFTEQLNAIREGFVLYDGVRHSPDVSRVGSWKEPLVVYFDTENLFNAVGFNGVLRSQLVRDFLALVSEARIKGTRLIHVKYFIECLDEVERFFHVAELIVDGKAQLDPSKPAMVAIVEGCSTRSDVLERKSGFFSMLDKLGIEVCSLSINDIDPRFNLDGESLQAEIKDQLGDGYREFNGDKCSSTLQMFTKINSLRRGKSAGPFESIGHVLVSESFLSRYLARHSGVVERNCDITFSVDLEFVTNRLWFKLHKGLGKAFAHPQSLSVLAKAQVVLSSQVNNSVSQKYDDLSRKFASGSIDKSQALYLLDELRSAARAPENIDESNVGAVVEFLSTSDLESMRRERSMLISQAEDGRRAVAELDAIRQAGRDKKVRNARRISTIITIFLVMLICGAIIFLGFCSLTHLISAQDSKLAIVGFLLTFGGFILGIFKRNFFVTTTVRFHSFLFDRVRLILGVD